MIFGPSVSAVYAGGGSFDPDGVGCGPVCSEALSIDIALCSFVVKIGSFIGRFDVVYIACYGDQP